MKKEFEDFMKEKYQLSDEDLNKSDPLSLTQLVWLKRAVTLVVILILVYLGYLIWQFNQSPFKPEVPDKSTVFEKSN
ncbi:MAG TPA: hypothetical protein PKY82_35775 [Pyrinomonadaceae bacterium]|nr:hypothetical protein [Pyrinomonadaceae bacterium]